MKKYLSTLLLSCFATLSQAGSITTEIVQLPHPPNGSLVHFPEQQQLAVSGFSQFSRWLSLVDLTSYNSRLLSIPADAQYFNKAKFAGEKGASLVFLGLDGVSRLTKDASGTELLFATPSIYRVLDENRLREADFVVDLGSGLSDFLVADFQYTHLYRQQSDGSFNHFALKIPALVRSWRTSPDYTPRQHYLLDADQDKRTDLAFVWQGQLQLFLQQADGSFSTEPLTAAWPVRLSTEQEADQRNDAGRSYNGQNIDTLRDITDIDGDGIPDLVIRCAGAK